MIRNSIKLLHTILLLLPLAASAAEELNKVQVGTLIQRLENDQTLSSPQTCETAQPSTSLASPAPSPSISPSPVVQKDPESWIDLEQFCSNPLGYMCHGNHNPSVMAVKATSDEQSDARKHYESNPKAVADFIRRSSSGKGQKCSDLFLPDYLECRKIAAREYNKKIFTPSRKKLTKKLFEKAKSRMRDLLTEKRAELLTQRNTVEAETVMQMIRKVESIKLVFRKSNAWSPATRYNMSAHFTPDITHRDNLSQWIATQMLGQPEPNTIAAEGMILEAEASPETLYASLLHEFSHFVSPHPSEFRKDQNLTGYPFKSVAACLKGSDSVGSKTADIKCLDAELEELKTTIKDAPWEIFTTTPEVPFTAQLYKLISKTKKANHEFPDAAVSLSPESKCQVGQINEAFSDWLGSEAFVQDNLTELRSAQNEPLPIGVDGKPKIDIEKRFEKLPRLLGSLAGQCYQVHFQRSLLTKYPERRNNFELDSHPFAAQRLSAIFLAHPEVKNALGCGQSKAPWKKYCDGK